MKKFKFLVRYGLKKRIGRKAFLISNIVIAVLMIAIINIPSIVSLFGGGEDPNEQVNIGLINETAEVSLPSDYSDLMNEGSTGIDYFVFRTINVSEFDLSAFWEDVDTDIVIQITGSIETPTVTFYSKIPQLNNYLLSKLELQLINYQITNYQSPVVNQIYAPDYEDPEQEAFISSMTSMLVLPMFILIVMATQFVGVDIIEEKSTKAIETIISSVPSKTHFLSKITASILFVIVQGALTIGYATIASLIGKLSASSSAVSLPVGTTSLLSYLSDIIPNWPVVLTFSLLFMIVGTLFYLVVASLFASMAVTQEDYQQFQTPLMLTLLAAFYIGIFAPMAQGYGFMKVMAFIPIFTPILAPIAYATGLMTVWEAIIALVSVSIFLIISLYLVAPVYKVAILSYDQTKFVTRIKNNFKKAFPKNGKIEAK
ncbi:MAG: ABC transporter permease [Acholeplasmataceae bacterium]|nr:ABC transporter permease [Acholeplasmataceae bacterium]